MWDSILEWIAAAPLAGASAAFLVGLTPGLLIGIFVGKTLWSVATKVPQATAAACEPTIGAIIAQVPPADVDDALAELAAALEAARREAVEIADGEADTPRPGAVGRPLEEAGMALERAGLALDRATVALGDRRLH